MKHIAKSSGVLWLKKLQLPKILLHITLAALPVTANALEGGSLVQPGVYQAIGRVNGGCTGTLIEDRRVLTAAHCVCREDNPAKCASRARFEFIDVYIDNAPGKRMNIAVDGNVRVHPEFGMAGWLREDIAVIELDFPASQVAPGITPIPVENPQWVPPNGTMLRLVGFGHSGTDCKGPRTKRMLDVPLTTSETARLKIIQAGKRNCPGDSGGPMLNSSGRVAGVMSWTGKEINGRPTHPNFNFIFNLPRFRWTDCNWFAVGAQRSHQPGSAWCPNGSFLTQFDLDGDRQFASHDAPVVGQARCCHLSQVNALWANCYWGAVGAQRSIDPGWSWCNEGDFLVAFDLDGDRNLPANTAPIVGQALCCRAQSSFAVRWGSSYLEPVGAMMSHQPGEEWCPDGSFLTRFELAGLPGYSDHDTPIVGRATCVRPRP
jgi:V8-like Glu-specific endopeptidase